MMPILSEKCLVRSFLENINIGFTLFYKDFKLSTKLSKFFKSSSEGLPSIVKFRYVVPLREGDHVKLVDRSEFKT